MDWSRDALAKRGFTGFVLFAELSSADVPTIPGVYVVLRPTSSAPAFVEISPAGWFKSKAPSVPVDELQRAWVPGTGMVYLRKADDESTASCCGAYVRRMPGPLPGQISMIGCASGDCCVMPMSWRSLERLCSPTLHRR